MRKRILLDYQIDLNEDTKKFIIDYFDKIKPENVITKKTFTDALRRLMSRSIVGTREEIDIRPEQKLKLYIGKQELWNKAIIENDSFDMEINDICKDDIQIGNCIKLYDLLDGDNILNKEIYQEQNNENKEINIQNQPEDREKEKGGDGNDETESEEEREEF